MPGVLAALLDKRSRAVRAARFRAWWEGEAFDEAAALAAIEESLAPTESPDKDKPAKAKPAEIEEDPLFEAPAPKVPPRVAALQRFWGEGRVAPGDAALEAALATRLGMAEDGILAVLGPGLAAPLLAIAGTHQGEIVAFEWRDETRPLLEHAIQQAEIAARIELRAMQLDPFEAPLAAFDGLISLDEFSYADLSGFAVSVAGSLRAGACALIETYVALPNVVFAPAFSTAFAEPQLCTTDDLVDALTGAGFAIEANDDRTQAHIDEGKGGFRRLERALTEAVEQGLDVAVLQEIAWEASAWRARMKLMAQRRIERRQIVARKQG